VLVVRVLEVEHHDARPRPIVCAPVDHATVGREPRRARDLSVSCDALAFDPPRRDHLVALRLVPLAGVAQELAVEIDPRSTGDLVRHAVDGPRNRLAAVRARDRRDRLAPVAICDVAHEVRAVEVPAVPVRPTVGDVRDLIDVEEAVLERIHAQVHVEHRRAQPSTGRALRFLPSRHALEEPARLHVVGRVHLAEQQVDDRRDPAPLIEVDDVGVLVRDEHVHPVVVVAQRRHRRRSRHEEPYRVEGQGGRRAVGGVRLVRHHDVRAPIGLVAHHLGEHLVGALGDEGRSPSEHPEGEMVVDREVRRIDAAPLEARVPRLGGGPGGAEPRRARRDQREEPDGLGARSHGCADTVVGAERQVKGGIPSGAASVLPFADVHGPVSTRGRSLRLRGDHGSVIAREPPRRGGSLGHFLDPSLARLLL
jgi:hypothetical protein